MILLLVGGTAKQVAEMRALVEKLSLTERCLFTGGVSKAEALRWTARGDILVSPRRSGTNTPLKIYEQLASGKPIVATRIWSHTQVLTDDVCFLVEPEAASMAQGLLAALRDPTRAAAVSVKARQLYDREYARPIYEAKIKQLMRLVTD